MALLKTQVGSEREWSEVDDSPVPFVRTSCPPVAVTANWACEEYLVSTEVRHGLPLCLPAPFSGGEGTGIVVFGGLLRRVDVCRSSLGDATILHYTILGCRQVGRSSSKGKRVSQANRCKWATEFQEWRQSLLMVRDMPSLVTL